MTAATILAMMAVGSPRRAMPSRISAGARSGRVLAERLDSADLPGVQHLVASAAM